MPHRTLSSIILPQRCNEDLAPKKPVLLPDQLKELIEGVSVHLDLQQRPPSVTFFVTSTTSSSVALVITAGRNSSSTSSTWPITLLFANPLEGFRRRPVISAMSFFRRLAKREDVSLPLGEMKKQVVIEPFPARGLR